MGEPTKTFQNNGRLFLSVGTAQERLCPPSRLRTGVSLNAYAGSGTGRWGLGSGTNNDYLIWKATTATPSEEAIRWMVFESAVAREIRAGAIVR